MSDAHGHAGLLGSASIGNTFSRCWERVRDTATRNEEAVRRVEISPRPLPDWSMTQAAGLILSSFDSSFAH